MLPYPLLPNINPRDFINAKQIDKSEINVTMEAETKGRGMKEHRAREKDTHTETQRENE